MASTTPSRLLENAMKYADQPALSTPSGDDWLTETWSEVAEFVMDIAKSLVALGFEPGDKLSIYSYNRREWYCGYLAAQMAGGAGVGIRHGLSQKVQTVRCLWLELDQPGSRRRVRSVNEGTM